MSLTSAARHRHSTRGRSRCSGRPAIWGWPQGRREREPEHHLFSLTSRACSHYNSSPPSAAAWQWAVALSSRACSTSRTYLDSFAKEATVAPSDDDSRTSTYCSRPHLVEALLDAVAASGTDPGTATPHA